MGVTEKQNCESLFQRKSAGRNNVLHKQRELMNRFEQPFQPFPSINAIHNFKSSGFMEATHELGQSNDVHSFEMVECSVGPFRTFLVAVMD